MTSGGLFSENMGLANRPGFFFIAEYDILDSTLKDIVVQERNKRMAQNTVFTVLDGEAFHE